MDQQGFAPVVLKNFAEEIIQSGVDLCRGQSGGECEINPVGSAAFQHLVCHVERCFGFAAAHFRLYDIDLPGDAPVMAKGLKRIGGKSEDLFKAQAFPDPGRHKTGVPNPSGDFVRIRVLSPGQFDPGTQPVRHDHGAADRRRRFRIDGRDSGRIESQRFKHAVGDLPSESAPLGAAALFGEIVVSVRIAQIMVEPVMGRGEGGKLLSEALPENPAGKFGVIDMLVPRDKRKRFSDGRMDLLLESGRDFADVVERRQIFRRFGKKFFPQRPRESAAQRPDRKSTHPEMGRRIAAPGAAAGFGQTRFGRQECRRSDFLLDGNFHFGFFRTSVRRRIFTIC